MISTQGFQANEKQMELFSESTETFPCLCKYVDLNNYVGRSVPWHWHPRAEINLFTQGSVIVQASDRSFHVKEGDAFFICANTLHSVTPCDPGTNAQYYTLFFDTEFLTGGYNTVFTQKYILPVTTCQELQAFHIRPGTPSGIHLLHTLFSIVELFREEPYGYEFTIREEFCRFWLQLLKMTEDIRQKSGHLNKNDENRIKQMLSFIEAHYPEKLCLEDIAGAAGIGIRECTRCFSRTIGITPFEYLNRYRIRTAAGMIMETNEPIHLIAEQCGFSSDSYFGRIFRELIGMTPRKYRKQT